MLFFYTHNVSRFSGQALRNEKNPLISIKRRERILKFIVSATRCYIIPGIPPPIGGIALSGFGTSVITHSVVNNLSEKLIEQYELRIKKLEEENKYLKSLLDKFVK